MYLEHHGYSNAFNIWSLTSIKPPEYGFSGVALTLQQNHGFDGVGRDLWRSPVQHRSSKRCQLQQVVQGLVRSSSEYPQGQRHYKLISSLRLLEMCACSPET